MCLKSKDHYDLSLRVLLLFTNLKRVLVLVLVEKLERG